MAVLVFLQLCPCAHGYLDRSLPCLVQFHLEVESSFHEVMFVFLALYVLDDGILQDDPWCVLGDGLQAARFPERGVVMYVCVIG